MTRVPVISAFAEMIGRVPAIGRRRRVAIRRYASTLATVLGQFSVMTTKERSVWQEGLLRYAVEAQSLNGLHSVFLSGLIASARDQDWALVREALRVWHLFSPNGISAFLGGLPIYDPTTDQVFTLGFDLDIGGGFSGISGLNDLLGVGDISDVIGGLGGADGGWKQFVDAGIDTGGGLDLGGGEAAEGSLGEKICTYTLAFVGSEAAGKGGLVGKFFGGLAGVVLGSIVCVDSASSATNEDTGVSDASDEAEDASFGLEPNPDPDAPQVLVRGQIGMSKLVSLCKKIRALQQPGVSDHPEERSSDSPVPGDLDAMKRGDGVTDPLFDAELASGRISQAAAAGLRKIVESARVGATDRPESNETGAPPAGGAPDEGPAGGLPGSGVGPASGAVPIATTTMLSGPGLAALASIARLRK